MLEILKTSLINSPVIKRGEYNYFIHPISDGVPSMDPHMIEEIAEYILKITDIKEVDTIHDRGYGYSRSKCPFHENRNSIDYCPEAALFPRRGSGTFSEHRIFERYPLHKWA